MTAAPARAPRRRIVKLKDGTRGYCMRADRLDECFAAALATLVQLPMSKVPDWRLHEREDAGDDPEQIRRDAAAQLDEWLGARGLQLVHHQTPPVECARWIGICPPSPEVRRMFAYAHSLGFHAGNFQDHCVVMAFAEVLHDPAIAVTPPSGSQLRTFHLSDVTHGFTVHTTTTKES